MIEEYELGRTKSKNYIAENLVALGYETHNRFIPVKILNKTGGCAELFHYTLVTTSSKLNDASVPYCHIGLLMCCCFIHIY